MEYWCDVEFVEDSDINREALLELVTKCDGYDWDLSEQDLIAYFPTKDAAMKFELQARDQFGNNVFVRFDLNPNINHEEGQN